MKKFWSGPYDEPVRTPQPPVDSLKEALHELFKVPNIARVTSVYFEDHYLIRGKVWVRLHGRGGWFSARASSSSEGLATILKDYLGKDVEAPDSRAFDEMARRLDIPRYRLGFSSEVLNEHEQHVREHNCGQEYAFVVGPAIILSNQASAAYRCAMRNTELLEQGIRAIKQGALVSGLIIDANRLRS